MKELVVSVASRRAAIVVDGRLDDLFIESQTRTTGNIYRGRVSRIEQSLSSAFVDIGSDKSAFLYITDVNPVLSGHKTSGRSPERTPSISSLLDNGQEILVQVTKPAAANKGSLV